MTYPKAYKGGKKIYISQLMLVLSTLVSFTSIVMQYVLILFDEQISEDLIQTLSKVSNILSIVGLSMIIVSFIVQLIGLIQAGKEERSFTIAFFIIVFSIVIGILLPIFSIIELPNIVSTILETVRDISVVFVILYTLTGFSTIAGALDDEVMELKGRRLIYVISVFFFFSIISSVVPQVIDYISEANITDALIYTILALSFVSAVAEVIVYFCCLFYYRKCIKLFKSK